jgi:hypothetical protein
MAGDDRLVQEIPRFLTGSMITTCGS